MASVTIKIDGLKELQARFLALSTDIQGKIGHGAVLAGANVIKRAAILNAPESPKTSTIDKVEVPPGTLKKNIVSKRVPKSQSVLTSEYVVAVRGKRKNKFASRFGSIVEFGSVDRPPEPFMRPAFDANKEAAVSKIVEILNKRITKAEQS